MGIFYAVMWFIVGLILIFVLSKENKIFYVAGAFFLLLGGWWLADSLLPQDDLFAGGWGLALRVVTIVALVALSVAFFLERQRNIKKEMEEEEKAADRQKARPSDPEDLRAGVSGVNLTRPREDDAEE